MMDVEVEPLFRPGQSLIERSRFICNIGGELSLWVVGSELRVYGADSYGIWLGSEEKIREQIAVAKIYADSKTIPAIARNYEAVLVYMRMLQGATP
jgi:hypothetical protein